MSRKSLFLKMMQRWLFPFFKFLKFYFSFFFLLFTRRLRKIEFGAFTVCDKKKKTGVSENRIGSWEMKETESFPIHHRLFSEGKFLNLFSSSTLLCVQSWFNIRFLMKPDTSVGRTSNLVEFMFVFWGCHCTN